MFTFVSRLYIPLFAAIVCAIPTAVQAADLDVVINEYYSREVVTYRDTVTLITKSYRNDRNLAHQTTISTGFNYALPSMLGTNLAYLTIPTFGSATYYFPFDTPIAGQNWSNVLSGGIYSTNGYCFTVLQAINNTPRAGNFLITLSGDKLTADRFLATTNALQNAATISRKVYVTPTRPVLFLINQTNMINIKSIEAKQIFDN